MIVVLNPEKVPKEKFKNFTGVKLKSKETYYFAMINQGVEERRYIFKDVFYKIPHEVVALFNEKIERCLGKDFKTLGYLSVEVEAYKDGKSVFKTEIDVDYMFTGSLTAIILFLLYILPEYRKFKVYTTDNNASYIREGISVFVHDGMLKLENVQDIYEDINRSYQFPLTLSMYQTPNFAVDVAVKNILIIGYKNNDRKVVVLNPYTGNIFYGYPLIIDKRLYIFNEQNKICKLYNDSEEPQKLIFVSWKELLKGGDINETAIYRRSPTKETQQLYWSGNYCR